MEEGRTRNQAVRDWVKHNLGLIKGKEYDVYLAAWRVGAKAAVGYRRVLEQSVLDDCVHDAMVKIHKSRVVLEMEHPAAYFCRAVENACRSRLRMQARDRHQQPHEFDDGAPWEETLPSRDPAIDILFEHESCWRQVVARLNDEQRRNLELALEIRYYGESADDAASSRGRSRQAVTQAVSNFVKTTLRRLIDEVCPGLVAEITGRPV